MKPWPLPWPLPWALLGMVLGTAAQLQQPHLWTPAAYGLCLALGVLMALWAWRCARLLHCVGDANGRGHHLWHAFLLLAMALALWGLCGLRASAWQAQAMDGRWEGQDLRLQGRVASMVQAGERGWRFRFEVESAYLQGQGQGQGQAISIPPRIELTWYAHSRWGAGGGDEDAALQPSEPLRPGQRWDFSVRLKAPHGARNPQGFDYELWLWEQGVQATGYVYQGKAQAPPVLVAQTWAYPVEQWRQRVRDAILVHLAQPPGDAFAWAQSARTAGVIAALVTGDQRAIERSDWALFRSTGVAHLMSISGLHITLFAALAQLAVGWLWRRSSRLCLRWPAPHAALIAGVLLAAGYALFSGWGVPAQRTILMLCVVAALRLSGRRWPWLHRWLLAAAAVVLQDPWALMQPGFWLSFVAVGILFATDFVAVRADDTRLTGRFGQIFRFLREQWVLTLALAPLTLVLFGQVSLVGLLANLLAIGWVTLWVTPLALLGLLWSPLWTLAAASMAPLLWVLEQLAAWPLAVFTLPAAPLWAGAVAVMGGIAIVMPWPLALRALGLPLLLPLLLWQAPRPAPGAFWVWALDVGQGSATLVQTANHALLYDAGPLYGPNANAGDRVVLPLLQSMGLRPELLMLSHGDSDHIGGAAALLAAQPSMRILGWFDDAHAAAAQGGSTPCRAGQEWQWDGVRFSVLHPQDGGQKTRNASSCVLRVQDARGAVALLTGDIERPQERALLAQGAPLKADWLLVAHHGSKTSSGPDFVQAVSPRWALVQAGYRNPFGHPHPDVVARWQGAGAQLESTPRCGAALWQSENPADLHCERSARRRYWQHQIRGDPARP